MSTGYNSVNFNSNSKSDLEKIGFFPVVSLCKKREYVIYFTSFGTDKRDGICKSIFKRRIKIF